jgi:uncharacterized protein (DUF433 family)
MDTIQNVEDLFAHMTRGEKARILQWVAQDLGDAFPGIDMTPDVCGGEPCIVRTRIPVRVLIEARKQGAKDSDILQVYPILRAEDLANAWAYYRSHRDEIERQIVENETA